MNKFAVFLLLIFSAQSFAADWSVHEKNMSRIEKEIAKHQNELDRQVAAKAKSRDRVRTEEILQRIVELHGELISLRRDLDTERRHIHLEHPDKISFFEKEAEKTKSDKPEDRIAASALDRKLDILLANIRLKYSGFMDGDDEEEQKEEVVQAEQVIEKKMKVKQERESEAYLRRKSKVKISK